MLNDSINIKDAYIINIGISFDIIVLPNYVSTDVIVKCINALQSFFNTSNWQINQPIILRDLYILLDKIDSIKQDIRTYGIWDRELFRHLHRRNIPLWTSIPGLTTQVDQCMSPGVDWKLLSYTATI